MDTFIDKLAQKTIANEIINANTAAEARENQKMMEQLAGYEEILQDMKQVSLKNIESATKVTELLEGIDLSSNTQNSAGISAEDMEELKSSLDGKADEIVKAGEDTANSIKYAAEDAVLSMKLSAEDAVNGVKSSAESAISDTSSSVEGIKSAADDAVSSVKSAAVDAVSEVKSALNEVVEALKVSADEAVAAAKNAGDDAANSVSNSIEDMKQVSLDATESIRKAVEEGLEAIKDASATVVRGGDAPQMDQAYLDAQFDDVHDAIHTENIKVYRNVQAAVDDSLEDQTKSIRGYIERTQKEVGKLPLVLGVANLVLNILIIVAIILNALGVF